MKITLMKIAEKTGLGYGTVSRALSDNPRLVKEKTRKKILRVANKYGYIKNVNAQALVKGCTADIGLVIPAIFGSSFYNDFYIKLISSVIETANHCGYKIRLLFLLRESGIKGVLNEAKSFRLAGLIYSSIYYGDFYVAQKDIQDINMPVVVINEHIKGRNVHSVILDDFKGGYDGTEYLIKLGHRKIGVIRGCRADIEQRFEGYKKAMADYGLAAKEKYVLKGDGTETTGYSETMRLLEGGNLPSAIYCLDDEMAAGALRAMREKGLNCPSDISILGFDGMDIGNFMNPRLTTMVRPVSEMGRIAVDKITGKDKSKKCTIIGVNILERESCCKG